MALKDLQEDVLAFVEKNDLEADVCPRLLDIASELGELAKEALRSTNYGKTPFSPNASWSDELGNLFFSLICLANTSDVQLEDALEEAMKKYQARIASTGTAASE